ncbi:glycosyltransferase [Cellvibrio polysaccharolyticus]|uniref:Glycosyltransferase n=1 Tax=Cellvibrio polysaccharolyticus TaxID=2082724 RepID=A0A928V3R8_9GAMM|nr:glycosyltransferase [Cellvibrio polysaccharolyticus]MBE8716042.1 glycosyltransferase [Cellvibrio polysaccharolyticus]
MKITILVDALHSIAAGSERQIFKLAEGLTAHKHDVELVLLRDTAFTRDGFDFPCAVRTLGISRIFSWNAIKTLMAFRQQLIQQGVQVVHAWFPDACILAPALLKSSRLRIITSRRDMGLIYHGKPSWIFRRLAFRTDAVVSNSAAVAELISQQEQLPDHKKHIIYNGIDAFDTDSNAHEAIFSATESIKLILVANVKPVKRTLDAIKAVHALLVTGHVVELALAGEKQDATYVQEIEAFIAEKGIADAIHWLGQVNEPRRLLSQADIGLLVSDSEGLSNTLMEYMQAGLPVVATNVGGNPELIIDGLNGILIEKGDITGLADAIASLANEPATKTYYGECAKARIEQEFSLKAMVIQHENLYGS